ncbi:MAG: bifunctional diaminohydroxyphosphoribosylaminopyrimidine deaminase/5-amino-6-(5-phosphoribosylamino)uracil reductase RibD [Muribaculaceae bacterium]|nr:bifunctional diaminohydroxyphosphoribosylaminopyrimidine deaminase/5-amino-6-(5-phosphoribosylamino)uracil reductase RibD [Muribaculaceae bacterium]
MEYDIRYMKRALQIAANGLGNTSPNPMVGAVIVNGSGIIIGEGYHHRCGEGHAEVNAIASVKDRRQLTTATMYVTLEPCSHYGKTPPCAKLIIDSGIPRVVVGCLDPFGQVSGRGIKMMREAGIEVVTQVLEQECRSLNAVFMTVHSLRRPFITLKWAQSRDGFIDRKREKNDTAARFSTVLTSVLVHRLRSVHDAIIVGNNTIISDNPRLNVRLWTGRNPIKIVPDRKGNIPSTAAVFNSTGETAIRLSALRRNDLPDSIITLKPGIDIRGTLETLYSYGITSLLVEGGAILLESFLNNGLWDYSRVEISAEDLKTAGSVKAPVIGRQPDLSEMIDGNMINHYTNNRLVQVKRL